MTVLFCCGFLFGWWQASVCVLWGFVVGWMGFFELFLFGPVGWGFCHGWILVLFSTESLILAQDERWRRA